VLSGALVGRVRAMPIDEDDFDSATDFDARDYDPGIDNELWAMREDNDYRSRLVFADPGGHSALRAATESNPRNLPCPTCGVEDRLTAADRARGYQCNECAESEEGYGP